MSLPFNDKGRYVDGFYICHNPNYTNGWEVWFPGSKLLMVAWRRITGFDTEIEAYRCAVEQGKRLKMETDREWPNLTEKQVKVAQEAARKALARDRKKYYWDGNY